MEGPRKRAAVSAASVVTRGRLVAVAIMLAASSGCADHFAEDGQKEARAKRLDFTITPMVGGTVTIDGEDVVVRYFCRN